MRDASGKTNVPHGGYVGPEGMVGDKEGTVLMCEHTNRRLVRVAKDLKRTVYLDKFEGKRFNSPNDLVFRSDGHSTSPTHHLVCRRVTLIPPKRLNSAASTATQMASWRPSSRIFRVRTASPFLPMEKFSMSLTPKRR